MRSRGDIPRSLGRGGSDIVVDGHYLSGNQFAVTPWLIGPHNMEWSDYLRDEAAKYRELAEQAYDPVIKDELLELASVCEEVANNIEDHLPGG